MEFEKVLNGIVEFLNQEVYKGMTGWQEVIARLAVSRVLGNKDKIKNTIMTNPFVKTFCIVDENGNIDIDGILCDLKEQIKEKERLEFHVPAFGKFVFTESDVDKLIDIMGGKQ